MICPHCGVPTEGPFDACCPDREREYEQGVGTNPGLWDTIAETRAAPPEKED